VLRILPHFNTEPVEAAIKLVETAAVAVFLTLLRTDPALAVRDRQDRTDQSEASES